MAVLKVLFAAALSCICIFSSIAAAEEYPRFEGIYLKTKTGKFIELPALGNRDKGKHAQISVGWEHAWGKPLYLDSDFSDVPVVDASTIESFVVVNLPTEGFFLGSGGYLTDIYADRPNAKTDNTKGVPMGLVSNLVGYMQDQGCGWNRDQFRVAPINQFTTEFVFRNDLKLALESKVKCGEDPAYFPAFLIVVAGNGKAVFRTTVSPRTSKPTESPAAKANMPFKLACPIFPRTETGSDAPGKFIVRNQSSKLIHVWNTSRLDAKKPVIVSPNSTSSAISTSRFDSWAVVSYSRECLGTFRGVSGARGKDYSVVVEDYRGLELPGIVPDEFSVTLQRPDGSIITGLGRGVPEGDTIKTEARILEEEGLVEPSGVAPEKAGAGCFLPTQTTKGENLPSRFVLKNESDETVLLKKLPPRDIKSFEIAPGSTSTEIETSRYETWSVMSSSGECLGSFRGYSGDRGNTFIISVGLPAPVLGSMTRGGFVSSFQTSRMMASLPRKIVDELDFETIILGEEGFLNTGDHAPRRGPDGTILPSIADEKMGRKVSAPAAIDSPKISSVAETQEPELDDDASDLTGFFETVPPMELHCDSQDPSPLQIVPGMVQFYESRCYLEIEIPPGASRHTSKARCSGEGSVWEETLEFRMLSQNMIEIAHNGSTSFNRYSRCAPNSAAMREVSGQIEEPRPAYRTADVRDMQARLLVLGFDPNGVDGAAGPGFEAAVTRWQMSNGFAATGYMTDREYYILRQRTDRAVYNWLSSSSRNRKLYHGGSDGVMNFQAWGLPDQMQRRDFMACGIRLDANGVGSIDGRKLKSISECLMRMGYGPYPAGQGVGLSDKPAQP